MTVIRLRVVSLTGAQEIEHAGGPLEVGRGPARDGVSRVVVDDPKVSRDHLRLTPVAGDLVRIENLSARVPVIVGSGTTLAPGDMVTVLVPLDLALGDTKVEVKLAAGKPVPKPQPKPPKPKDDPQPALEPVPVVVKPKSDPGPPVDHWVKNIRATEPPNNEPQGTGFEVPLPPRSPTSANDLGERPLGPAAGRDRLVRGTDVTQSAGRLAQDRPDGD